MSDIEQQKEHFNSIAMDYYYARQNPNSLLFKQLLWKYILSHLPPRSKATVLEAMCGYAEGEEIVKSHYCINVDYTGFDYSEKLIELVRQLNPTKRVFVQDVTTFKPDSLYDIILIIGGLHHVPDYTEKVLLNLRNGLTDDGYFISFEPTHGNRIAKMIRKRVYRSSSIVDYTTERDYEIHELNKLYKNAGYEIVHQFYPGLLAYSLYYNPDIFPKLVHIGRVMLKMLFTLEKPLYMTRFAKIFSFATMTILRRKEGKS